MKDLLMVLLKVQKELEKELVHLLNTQRKVFLEVSQALFSLQVKEYWY